MKKFLLLHNIRSVNNVGAIFRTADAIGIDQIFLCGYTPAPIDRFGRVRNNLHKTALGAEKSVLWQAEPDISVLIERLKKDGFQIIALEQYKDSVDYKKIVEKLGNKVAIILGNEVNGIESKILKKTDFIVEIPMRGEKESLNVSVSAGILLYRLFD